MRALFDHNVPKKLRSLLPGHEVVTSRELAWNPLKNGKLLSAAGANGFEVMVTGNKNMSYQQNLEGRRLALVILADTDWPTLGRNPASIVAALHEATPGSFKLLAEPALPRRPSRRSGPAI